MIEPMEARLDRYLNQQIDERELIEKLTRTEELMREQGYLMREWRAVHNHIDRQEFDVVPEETWRDELNQLNARLHQIQIELRREELRTELQTNFRTLDLLHEGINKCDARMAEIEAEISQADEALENSKAVSR